MKVLVTGGLGFIGSNTVVELIENGFTAVIVDNLSNSSIEVLRNIKKITGVDIEFYKEDVRNIDCMEKIFQKHSFEGVIHFAGYKAVGESVEQPLKYYENNLMSTIKVSELCLKYSVNKFIFSSSASVYGELKSPLIETMENSHRANPYGETKAMCERILTDVAKVNKNFSVDLLRYFNPIGGHKSGLLCEKPNGTPNNLMPYIIQVAENKKEYLNIYGDDYNTEDGTGVRDYIHVTDLAIGHVKALKNTKSGVNIYNLGSSKGISVLQLVKKFEEVNNIEIPYKILGRRLGDVDISYADCTKAKNELGFKAKYGIEDMCRDSISK